MSYLEVSAEPVDAPTARQLTAHTSSGDFTLSFQQHPGETDFVIPIGRMWFWTDDAGASFESDGWMTASRIVDVRDTGFLY